MWSLLILFAEDAPAQPAGGMMSGIMPLILMAGLGFFLLILPMRRQQRQQREQMSSVKKNDKVITSGGIIGVVLEVREKKDDDIKEDEVVLRVDDNSNTRIRVLKSSIVRVFPSAS